MEEKVLFILSQICSINEKPGKKLIQKLMYLVQEKGVDLGLDYRIYYYGPYSRILDQLLRYYELENYLDIDTSETTHTVKLRETVKCTGNGFSAHEKEVVKQVLAEYAQRKPYDLELLTTTEFAANYILNKDTCDEKAIVNKVKEIKGSKFTVKQIQASVKELKSADLLGTV